MRRSVEIAWNILFVSDVVFAYSIDLAYREERDTPPGSQRAPTTLPDYRLIRKGWLVRPPPRGALFTAIGGACIGEI